MDTLKFEPYFSISKVYLKEADGIILNDQDKIRIEAV